MTVRTKITFREYLELMYRRAIIIVFTIGAFLMLLIIIVNATGLYRFQTNVTSQITFIFFIIVLLPIVVYFSAKRNYYSNKRLQETIDYEFTNQKMNISGESFSSEINWSKTFKIEELKKWFLIYQSKQVANLIPKSDLTEEQISYLRFLFSGLENIIVKLRR